MHVRHRYNPHVTAVFSDFLDRYVAHYASLLVSHRILVCSCLLLPSSVSRECVCPVYFIVSACDVLGDHSKLSVYEAHGLGREAIGAAMDIGACAECDAREKRWNHHFQVPRGLHIQARD